MSGSSWLVFMLPAIIASIVIIGLVGLLVYLRRHQPNKHSEPISSGVSASLVNLETNKTHVIDTTPWRIGRSKINSLAVDDHSVSRAHAEINIDELGNFHVTDLDSLNGVYVNETKIETSPINNGDLVDVGDIRFRFNLEAVAGDVA
ncbi:MAG: FHA domain-containing protein [Pseudomonadota bacterium]